MTEVDSRQPPRPTRHVRRLVTVLLIAWAAWFGLQQVLKPAGYGLFGGYRSGSLTEILAQEPVHQGQEECARCHRDVFELHEKDIHFDVECEDCHGPGRGHVRAHDAAGGEPVIGASMPKEYTLEGCLFCHRRLSARPRDFPQVDQTEHYAFLGVTNPKTKCIECHSPHEPIFLLTRVREARIHPVIHECASCHDPIPDGDHLAIEAHPVIFTCRDCHRDVVADFEGRKHAFMRCTACHLFHLENPTAGRIMKNGNRRFCLLCHERKPFKDPEHTPLIDPEVHLGEMAELLEVDAESMKSDPRTCLQCHRKHIHGMRKPK